MSIFKIKIISNSIDRQILYLGCSVQFAVSQNVALLLLLLFRTTTLLHAYGQDAQFTSLHLIVCVGIITQRSAYI